ncbi:MAG: hypothetical protein FJY97_16785 [candidate division Zixibacteria bacterium]|nr:hypothetical protein [candidate division Zixibacteria bacterium]
MGWPRQSILDQFGQILSGPLAGGGQRGLRRLADPLRDRKVVVKLYLRHPLHAKLYLLYRFDPISPLGDRLSLTQAREQTANLRSSARWD